jgi:5'-nucleotidase
MTDILLTNDDGYRSAGFLPLLKQLSKEFSVVAIAPDEERSWIGKAITSRKTLNAKKVNVHGVELYSLNGTPADCVQIGLYTILDSFPKMVISGINQGVNIGHARILSSGTIGAAIEASIHGVPSLASSILIPSDKKKDLDLFDEKNFILFDQASRITSKIATILVQDIIEEDIDLFSINIPFDATIGSTLKITKPFRESYGRLFYEKDEGYTLKTPQIIYENMRENTDLKALYEGNISLTPINLDLTRDDLLKRVEQRIIKHW